MAAGGATPQGARAGAAAGPAPAAVARLQPEHRRRPAVPVDLPAACDLRLVAVRRRSDVAGPGSDVLGRLRIRHLFRRVDLPELAVGVPRGLGPDRRRPRTWSTRAATKSKDGEDEIKASLGRGSSDGWSDLRSRGPKPERHERAPRPGTRSATSGARGRRTTGPGRSGRGRADHGRRRSAGCRRSASCARPGCGVDIGVAGGRIVGVRGRGDDRVNHGRLGPKGLHGWEANASGDRLTAPLIRRGGRLEPTTWDEAMTAAGGPLEGGDRATTGPVHMASTTPVSCSSRSTTPLPWWRRPASGRPTWTATRACARRRPRSSLIESFGTDGQPGSYTDFDRHRRDLPRRAQHGLDADRAVGASPGPPRRAAAAAARRRRPASHAGRAPGRRPPGSPPGHEPAAAQRIAAHHHRARLDRLGIHRGAHGRFRDARRVD